MTTSFRIDTNAQKAEVLLHNISVELPKEMAEAGYDITKLAQRNLRLELTRQHLIDTGRLWQGVRAVKQSNNRSVVTIPKHGVHLDSMRPHYVKLKRGRLIREWAKRKGNLYIKSALKGEQSIEVKPHPWIDAGLQRSLINIRSILRRRAKNAMDKSKG